MTVLSRGTKESHRNSSQGAWCLSLRAKWIVTAAVTRFMLLNLKKTILDKHVLNASNVQWNCMWEYAGIQKKSLWIYDKVTNFEEILAGKCTQKKNSEMN
jgi:hypothetical protein